MRPASSIPANSGYRIDLLRETKGYARELIERGDEARRNGNAAEAAALYTQALKIDPANDRARRGLASLELDARSVKLLAESERLLREGNLAGAQERVDAALADNPANANAQRQQVVVREQAEKARQARAAQAAAQSIMNKPVTLQFRDANLRMVFEALSRTTGLNVILDRDVRADLKTTIFVKDAAVEDTVDLILLQNQLEKRALNANTLFIYPATAAKQKEYQDLQVRTFQVTNVDVKYLQTRAEDGAEGQGHVGRRTQRHAGDARHRRRDRRGRQGDRRARRARARGDARSGGARDLARPPVQPRHPVSELAHRVHAAESGDHRRRASRR